jgi:hypothetical protein
MPIVLVHGVGLRPDDARQARLWQDAEHFLRQHVAPVMSDHPHSVTLLRAYWGDIGAQYAWGGASCPPATVSQSLSKHPLVSLLPISGQRRQIFRELGRRSLWAPGYALSRLIALVRRAINDQVAVFLGDAFGYFATRGSALNPGPIPLRVLATLREAARIGRERHEPLVVLTHSMGGQIVYDLVTHFLPNLPDEAPIQIDFWCSASSQIGLFEELKLFLASRPEHGPGNPVPFPDTRLLRAWWNMWDPNDFLSFTAHGIIAGLDDEPYDSGLMVGKAHDDFLKQPSFYTTLARKIAAARVQ